LDVLEAKEAGAPIPEFPGPKPTSREEKDSDASQEPSEPHEHDSSDGDSPVEPFDVSFPVFTFLSLMLMILARIGPISA